MDLLKNDIKKLYTRYLLTGLGSSVLSSIYVTVDTVVVGQYEGPVGSASLACISPLWSIMFGLGILFGVGGAVMMSVARGAGDEDAAGRYFTVSLLTALAVAAAVTALFVLRLPEMLRVFGADEELMPYCVAYMRWIAYTVPSFLIGQYLVSFVRNDNAPELATVSIIAGGALNIVGDLYFVYGCDMGISGAGLATALGQTVSCLVLCSHFFSKGNRLRIARPIAFFRDLRKIAATGFSPFLVDMSFGITVLFFNRQIMHWAGSVELAVFGVVSNCAILLQSLYYGVGNALQPIVSFNLGAAQHARVAETRRMALRTTLILGVLFLACGELFPTLILRLYMDATPAVLAVGPAILRKYAVSFLFMGVNIVGGFYLQSVLRSGASLLISLLRGVLLCTAFILLLPRIAGFDSIWWAMPLTELLTAGVTAALLHRYSPIPPAVQK